MERHGQDALTDARAMAELKLMIKKVTDSQKSRRAYINWDELNLYYKDSCDDVWRVLLDVEDELNALMWGKIACATRAYAFRDVMVALHGVIGLARYIFADQLADVCAAYINALEPVIENSSFKRYLREVAAAIEECNDDLQACVDAALNELKSGFSSQFAASRGLSSRCGPDGSEDEGAD